MLTNNMLFSPLYSQEVNESNALFASPYVLNTYGIDKAVYLKK
nr:hypothetical protein [Mycoplasmopsis bovis]